MATRTAIAAKDRKVKEAELAEKKRQFDKSHDLEKKMLTYKQMESASNTTRNLIQAAYGKSGLAGAMGKGSGSGFTRSNDPSWYKKFNLSAYSVKLPTFYRLGSEIQTRWLNDSYNDVVPGIATLVYAPTLPNQLKTNVLGSKYYQTSPLNQSLTRFMAELRKLNSRQGDYDPSDIGLYWYAVIGVIIDLGSLQKAIKGYNTYYSENNYLSRAFIKSCGFDPDDFYAHVPEYKALLIKCISMFNANAVIPSSLDFIKRYAWMSTVVVKEHKGMNSQLYHFRCGYDLRMSDEEEYVAVSAISGYYLYSTFANNIETKMQNLFNSVGVVTMTADLRAAFPDSSLLKWPDFQGNEQLEYSDSVYDLEQIHNARTLPSVPALAALGDSYYNPNQLSRLNIVVDSEGYLAQGAFSAGNLLPIIAFNNYDLSYRHPLFSVAVEADNQFLNFYDTDFISDDSILESTRFRYSLFAFNADFSGHAFKEIGTEVITHIEVTMGRTDSPDPDIGNYYTDYYTANYGLSTTELFFISQCSTFDWLPWIRLCYKDESEQINTVGEIDHAIPINNDNLRIIHEGCAFSLFYVDTFAKGHVA